MRREKPRQHRAHDLQRLKSLVHYICSKCPDRSLLGATKLNKILWYTDTMAMETWGKSMTGATYVKRQFGPVPKQILRVVDELVKTGDLAIRNVPFHNYEKREYVSLSRPDISIFTPQEISLVDEVIATICFDHTATSISLASHDRIWELAEIGEEIPLETVFASELDEITEDDVKWAKRALRRTA